jgi:hypothetical protein
MVKHNMRTQSKIALAAAALALGIVGGVSITAQESPDSSCIRACTQDLAQAAKACRGDKACIEAAVAAARECLSSCGVPSH